jgi:CBS domain containing-hemolysin-like protein
LTEPDSSSLLFITLLFCLFALHALFAAGQEAIMSLRHSRRLQLIEKGNSAAVMIDRWLKEATHRISAERLALKLFEFLIITLALWTYTTPLAQLISPKNNLIAILVIIAVTMTTLLIVGELIPREIGRNYAEFLALKLIYPLHLFSYLASPVAEFVARFGRIFSFNPETNGGYPEPDVITEDDLRTYMDASEEGGMLNEVEKEMIYSIFNLDDTFAREVMIPRIDVVAIEANTSTTEALDIILAAGHSRLPVYVESIDNIVGILYAKDLLTHWQKGGRSRPVLGLEREVYFVPETKPVSELLPELQARKIQIAIVVDEYGGVAGLVTIEDIIEEIVGEIQDEYDLEEFYLERISEDEFIFSARMDLDDINNIMTIDLPTDETDTLGGLVYTTFGGVPEVGDMVEIENLRLTVLSVDGRRIKTVKIQRQNTITTPEQHKSAKVIEKTNSRLVAEPSKVVSRSS